MFKFVMQSNDVASYEFATEWDKYSRTELCLECKFGC
jgi:hypothetical protein